MIADIVARDFGAPASTHSALFKSIYLSLSFIFGRRVHMLRLISRIAAVYLPIHEEASVHALTNFRAHEA